MSKSQSILKKIGTPKLYIKCLVELEEFLKDANEKEAKKKMDLYNAKALTAMTQKIRKHNKQFEAQIEDFKAVSSAFSDFRIRQSKSRIARKVKKKVRRM